MFPACVISYTIMYVYQAVSKIIQTSAVGSYLVLPLNQSVIATRNKIFMDLGDLPDCSGQKLMMNMHL